MECCKSCVELNYCALLLRSKKMKLGFGQDIVSLDV